MTVDPAAGYVRPPLDVRVFYDDAGREIRYGDRWPIADGPPDDAYSRVSNPERFLPLIGVVDALVAHLDSSFVVEVVETVAEARTVQLKPIDDDQAPVVLTVYGTGEVSVQAGAVFGGDFPPCTCDACDESAHTQAPELERSVFAAVGGHLTEEIVRRRPLSVRVWSEYGGHAGGGVRTVGGKDGRDPNEVQAVLDARSGPWRPWTRRGVGASD